MEVDSGRKTHVRGTNIRYSTFVGRDGERGEQNISRQNVVAMYALLKMEPRS